MVIDPTIRSQVLTVFAAHGIAEVNILLPMDDDEAVFVVPAASLEGIDPDQIALDLYAPLPGRKIWVIPASDSAKGEPL